MSDHRPGTQIYFIQNSMFQCGSSFRGFLEFYRMKKVISQGKFKICWWVHQRGRHVEMGGRAILQAHADDSPSSGTGGS